MNNLADDPELAGVARRLKRKLNEWMESQGDQGIATELDALLHQGRYRGMTREQALDAWQKKNSGRQTKRQQPNRKKKSKGGV